MANLYILLSVALSFISLITYLLILKAESYILLISGIISFVYNYFLHLKMKDKAFLEHLSAVIKGNEGHQILYCCWLLIFQKRTLIYYLPLVFSNIVRILSIGKELIGKKKDNSESVLN
jgi:hypothetical protein